MAGQITFGQRLRVLRYDAGLSQTELAAKAGIPQTSIAAWELDKADPGWSKVQALCRALGVTCEAFAAVGLPANDAPAAAVRDGKGKGRRKAK